MVTIHALLPPSVELFDVKKKNEDVLYSTILFDSSLDKKLTSSLQENINFKNKIDSSTKSNVTYFTDSAGWQQIVKASVADSFTIKGNISYLYKKSGAYLSGEQHFHMFVQPQNLLPATVVAGTGITENKSLWWIFFTAFAGGLLALLTPCVYSMIPITVSFFTKRSKSKKEGVRNALYYSASIIIIFTVFGFLITLLFGPAALNNLATNWIANLVFFFIFILFGISFLGAFEITLPSSWSTGADTKAGASSFAGIFFMALTLVLVSFSCTGPIIGNLLVLAAKGSYYGPLTGMFGFSTALALPFAFFAFFPSKLNVLGKAGGWLNAIKVTLGFLELALALKFLSNADLSKGWRLLDREVFICIWIGIFIALGFYLFGFIKLSHDDQLPKNDFDVPHLSVTRLLVAIASFCFAFYMMPGLWGAPLKGISAFLPPMGTQDFTSTAVINSVSSFDDNNENNSLPKPIKYADKMSMYEPDVVKKYRMVTYFDYDEALSVSRKLHKPLMLDFTGINCVNCRKMEAHVWSDPEVMKRLKNNFVIVSLYVDVHDVDLPLNEQFYSKALDKQVETLGDKNADRQVTKYGANTQPYYFFIDGTENRLANEGYGYDPDVKKFTQQLNEVKEKYQKENR